MTTRETELSLEADDSKRIADYAFRKSAKETDEEKIRRWVTEGNKARTAERKAVKKLKRFPERLEALKRTLSAFDTETMPFAAGDGVVMQR